MFFEAMDFPESVWFDWPLTNTTPLKGQLLTETLCKTKLSTDNFFQASGQFIIKADANEDGRQKLYFVMDSFTFYLGSKCSDQIDKDHKFEVLLSLGYAHIFPLTHLISYPKE